MKTNLFAGTEIAPALTDCGFCLWDIGARGGIDPHFAPFAFAIDAVGFEPDPAAFAALAVSGEWHSETFVETALGGAATGTRLHIPVDPAGASFLQHDTAIGARYGLEDLFEVRQTVDLETVTMDAAVSDLGVPAPNLLKLDVEGLELDILQSGREALKNVVAVKLEAGFMRQRIGQPVAGELIAMLEENGLSAVDIVEPARWRKRPWAADPYMVRRNPAYSRGRLAQADIIFLREPASLAPGMARRAALAAIGLGYFDHGLELLEAGDTAEAEAIRPAAFAASKRYGRARAREELRNAAAHVVLLVRSLAGGVNTPPAARPGP